MVSEKDAAVTLCSVRSVCYAACAAWVRVQRIHIGFAGVAGISSNINGLLSVVYHRRVYMWVKLMKAGSLYGCHQLASRSFFIQNRQLPLCARCSGVMIGSLFAYALFFFWTPPLLLCISGLAIMFADWLIQYLKIKESTNPRRLITGLIGGYSLATLFCMGVRLIFQMIYS